MKCTKQFGQIKHRSNTAARELCKSTLIIVNFHHDHDSTRPCPSTHASHCPIHTPGSRLVEASGPVVSSKARWEPDIITKADNCQHFNTSHDWHNWHTWSKPANVIQQTSLISQETVVWSLFLATQLTLSYLMPLFWWYLGNEPAESHHWQQSKQNILQCR